MSGYLTFSQIPYVRPNLEELQETINKIGNGFQTSENPQEHIALIRAWNSIRVQVSTMATLAEVRYTQNVADEFSKGEKNFFDNNSPTITELNTKIANLILASKFRTEIEQEFGSLFLRRLQDAKRIFASEIKEILIEESDLCTQYNDITAAAKIDVDGVTYNLSTIGALNVSLDRDTRKKSVAAVYSFFEQNSDAIDAIYDRLVKLRTKKAAALGFNSYTEYRYVEMGRVDYNAEMVEVFRNQVVEHVVPMAQQLRNAQSKRLGISDPKIYDEKLQFIDGNPVANGDHDWIVERAKKMYNELSEETSEFFNFMFDRELLDLKSRDNKATGGYCTSFPAFEMPFIFANFNQTTHDIEVLTHEAGHAFQAYRSRVHEMLEYQWPTSEACEVHSMGMEFLTWPWMESFFGSQIDKFKFYHLQGALLFLPYGCAVDEYQHWVYANPEVSPAERNAHWKTMEHKYMPWRNTSDIPYADKGTQWQLQRHIIESPFYYIDYALAQTCALQYWVMSQENPTTAFASYLKICDIGGSKAFLDIVSAGGLHSPFEPSCLPAIVTKANNWLQETYPNFL